VRSMLLGRANRQDQQCSRGAADSFPASDLMQEDPGG
jgi:hypothetical protein